MVSSSQIGQIRTSMIIIAIVATLGAVGVMTTMITTATTVDAAKECHRSPNGAAAVCPPGTQGKCPEGSPGCGAVCTSNPDISCRIITPGQ